MEEQWKQIDFNTKYEVSNFGRIRKRLVKRRPYNYLKLDTSNFGHKRINLWLDKKSKRFLVHRLVALAFIPNPENHPIINHIDANPANNRAENLEWCDQSHNTKHAYKIGTMNAKGSKNGLSILTEEIVLQIRDYAKKGLSQNNIGAKYGILQSHVSQIVNRKIWTHV